MSSFEMFVPLAKVGLVFVLMMLSLRNKIGLVWSILGGALLLGLIFGMSLPQWGYTAVAALSGDKFLHLLFIVALILLLSGSLEKSGQSRRLMDSLAGYLTHPRLRLIFFPALIGLLPMPGGAVFSAPMVKSVSEGIPMTPERRALINYWFRHIWELAWPMYPGIILIVSLADISIGSFISRTWPGFIAMSLAGWFCYLSPRVLPIEQLDTVQPVRGDWRKIAWEGLPLLIAIIGSVVMEAVIVAFFPFLSMEYGVIVALLAAGLCTIIQNRLSFRFLLELMGRKSVGAMLAVIASVFIFKDVMQDAGVVQAMAQAGGGFALFFSAVILPFLVGAIAGITFAFVGATFPLLLGLLQALGMGDQVVAYLVLASFSGFTGVLISPLHICLLLTCEFFEASLSQTWRQLLVPCLCFFLTGIALFAFLSS